MADKVPLPHSADVVIIGAGVVGASIAFHLAEAGVRHVVVVERGDVGGGSTARAAGGVRAQFSDRLNIQLAARSLDLFANFGSRPGYDIGLQQVGYLFLLTTERDVDRFRESIELQHEYGVPSRFVSPDEAHRLSPLVNVDDVLAAAFSPTDGYATPAAVAQGYASSARIHGVHIETGCDVSDICSDGGQIKSVCTTRGEIATTTVVCAAGAWSAGIGEMVGSNLPVVPVRRQVLFTEEIRGLPSRMPMTVDFATTFYFHREGPGVLMGMSDSDERPGFDTGMTDSWTAAVGEVAMRRAPKLAEVGIRGGWAGLYETTPDNTALIGELDTPSRFVYATGFSGHGFLQAPAVGEIVRDLVLKTTPCVDVAPLSVERFRSGRHVIERNII